MGGFSTGTPCARAHAALVLLAFGTWGCGSTTAHTSAQTPGGGTSAFAERYTSTQGDATFQQTSSGVSVEYPKGRMLCTGSGDALDCKWREGDAMGRALLTRYPDGSIAGTRGDGDSANGGGNWVFAPADGRSVESVMGAAAVGLGSVRAAPEGAPDAAKTVSLLFKDGSALEGRVVATGESVVELELPTGEIRKILKTEVTNLGEVLARAVPQEANATASVAWTTYGNVTDANHSLNQVRADGITGDERADRANQANQEARQAFGPQTRLSGSL